LPQLREKSQPLLLNHKYSRSRKFPHSAPFVSPLQLMLLRNLYDHRESGREEEFLTGGGQDQRDRNQGEESKDQGGGQAETVTVKLKSQLPP